MTELIERDGDTALAAIKRKLPGYGMPSLDFTSTGNKGRTPKASQEGSGDESVEGPLSKVEVEEYLRSRNLNDKNFNYLSQSKTSPFSLYLDSR